MANPTLLAKEGVRIAVEGCGHGTLHAIYASIAKSCDLKGWNGVDLLIIGGDFQAVRNAHDLQAVSMPAKYYAMHDFHEYYSGARTAPYLTIFIGGNHEASNYMWELYYGGWVAPNIYYMGAANIVRLGPLRIAGLSGIWKGHDYKKPHFERLPYNASDVKSIYHVRELDTRKLLQVRSQVDIGLSHDWPRGVEWKGNFKQLFRFKPYFEQEAKDGTLGSVAATKVLQHLRPPHWFSAHMHCKYAAKWQHVHRNPDEVFLDSDSEDDTAVRSSQNGQNGQALQPTSVGPEIERNGGEAVDGERHVLKAVQEKPVELLPITNEVTQFLALDKCLPNRHFLQLLEVAPQTATKLERPLSLEYDKEWLAITRVFSTILYLGDPDRPVPGDRGEEVYRPLIAQELEWVEENIVKPGKLSIPEDFQQTAPVYDATQGIQVDGQPQEYTNPHTQTFCDLLQIENPFHASDEERTERMRDGPRPDTFHSDRGRGGHRGGQRGGRGRGRGSGGMRGAQGRAHGRGRGR
ncbi:DBR1-domain-containing protein [Lophiostoma macrostomum CBS 122681]|uniref:DBR1-domain-containing protein n=1 Tax=Lophiostoma macrostomum CBS 122681 TaxID=1314788 RepID=A0A6A6SYY1_9PLEO|nr:DBR1-domain-containing protein [Lophiostoma macrostomum CBS 122681]